MRLLALGHFSTLRYQDALRIGLSELVWQI